VAAAVVVAAAVAVVVGSHCSAWQEVDVDDPNICGRQSPRLCLQKVVFIIFALFWGITVSSGNLLPTFRDNATLRYTPEEHIASSSRRKQEVTDCFHQFVWNRAAHIPMNLTKCEAPV
jgi:hypothetical protein